MTKKNFVAIAVLLGQTGASEKQVLAFIEYLKTTNANFDEDRFRETVEAQ